MYVHTKTHVQMFIAALFIGAKICKQPNCSPSSKEMHKMWCIHTIDVVCVLNGVRLRDPMDYSPPGSSVHGIFQTRILEWESSWPSDWTCISCASCIGRWILYHCATWEAPEWMLLRSKNGINYWHMVHNRWTLIMSCSVRHKRPHIIWFHLQEMSRKGKLRETDIKLMIAWVWRREQDEGIRYCVEGIEMF